MFILKSVLTLLFVVLTTAHDYEKLPNCLESFVPGLVLVSTIDGKFSALTSEGALKWQIDTDPGPLLVSNIHSLELTNSGKWIRIIPSLNGALYRFDGSSIDPISISAESLLRSSFKYSDDLVIAGGLEVRTYGIGFRSGKIYYTCSTLNCVNTTNSENEAEDILLLERTTQIVRAVESQTGHERWNFSVGQHNIKSTQVSCADPNVDLFNWNITAIIPDGLLLASNYQDNVKTTWQYHFPSPIVRVWKWNGHKLSEIDLFQLKSDSEPTAPAIYLGMHKKQLYIHESYALQNRGAVLGEIAETTTVGRIPWKPISASDLLTEDDSTAISVLYSSEYVNGHGYYLYSEETTKEKSGGLCKNNKTLKFPTLGYDAAKSDSIKWFVSLWWKEILVALITTSLLFNLLFRSFTRRQNQKQVIFVERPVEIPVQRDSSSSDRLSESSDGPFSSRYLNDFDTLRCLGKGGFGVVFEVKQKIDECHYAIKRIILPNEKHKRESVMREVKALAKLEHSNIVRYFNSWVEQPPVGWQQQHDNEWIKETNDFLTETTTNHNTTALSTKNSSVDIKFVSSIPERSKTNNDSFIVFENSEGDDENTPLKNDESNRTDTVSYDDSHTSGVNWRRPSRRYHCINDTSLPKEPPTFLYIQMQLCQRQSLREWLVENKDRHFDDILHIFKQIVSAVEYVHLQGLIHRDLKPSNIFFSLDGQIKIGDFGLVKDEDESHDASNGYSSLKGHTKEVGTRLYMSPEQLNGQKYNYKVDIYSLGLIFFELLVYFSTDMERVRTMTDLRDNKFPKNFVQQYTDEYNLLTLMLCQLPEKRLTTFGIRARPPLNCCDSDYNKTYDFELPKSIRNVGLTSSKT